MKKFIDKLSERERKGEKERERERERLNIKIIGSVCACEKKNRKGHLNFDSQNQSYKISFFLQFFDKRLR
jgi:hypothetical protein